MSIAAKKEKNSVYYLKAIIGIVIMFGFKLIPAFGGLTNYGVELLGILIGCVWLWTTCGMVWPSALGLIALALTENGGTSIITTAFSNSNVILLFFVFPIFGILSDSGAITKASILLMSRKFIQGRPYLLAFILMAIAAIMSSFANGLVMVLLLWGIIKSLATSLSLGHDDKFTTFLITGVVYASLMGYVCVPFIAFGLILNGVFTSYTKIVINSGSYMLIMFGMTFAAILLYLFVMKFILRIDVSAYKNIDIAQLEAKNGGAKLTHDQKFLLAACAVFIILLCLPTFITTGVLGTILSKLGILGISLIFMVILSIVKDSENKPYLNMYTAGKHVAWDMVFLFACALQLSSMIGDESSGMNTLMSGLLTPLLGGHGTIALCILFAVLTLILTNFANNWVILLLMISTLSMYSFTDPNFNASVGFMMVAFCGNVGLFIPAASMYAAMLHGDEWMTSSKVYKTTGICLAITVLVVIVFTPLANVII